jgi:Skp family chaperone for outer membrane proteins
MTDNERTDVEYAWKQLRGMNRILTTFDQRTEALDRTQRAMDALERVLAPTTTQMTNLEKARNAAQLVNEFSSDYEAMGEFGKHIDNETSCRAIHILDQDKARRDDEEGSQL